MKKIAIVHDAMLVGGTEISLLELLNQIDYQQYEVTLFLKNATGPLGNKINKAVAVRYWNIEDSRKILKKQIENGHLIRVFKGMIYRFLARVYSKNWDKNMLYATKCLTIKPVADYFLLYRKTARFLQPSILII